MFVALMLVILIDIVIAMMAAVENVFVIIVVPLIIDVGFIDILLTREIFDIAAT